MISTNITGEFIKKTLSFGILTAVLLLFIVIAPTTQAEGIDHTISLQAEQGAVGYYVFVWDTKTEQYVSQGYTTSTTYTLEGAVEGRKYLYIYLDWQGTQWGDWSEWIELVIRNEVDDRQAMLDVPTPNQKQSTKESTKVKTTEQESESGRGSFVITSGIPAHKQEYDNVFYYKVDRTSYKGQRIGNELHINQVNHKDSTTVSCGIVDYINADGSRGASYDRWLIQNIEVPKDVCMVHIIDNDTIRDVLLRKSEVGRYIPNGSVVVAERRNMNISSQGERDVDTYTGDIVLTHEIIHAQQGVLVALEGVVWQNTSVGKEFIDIIGLEPKFIETSYVNGIPLPPEYTIRVQDGWHLPKTSIYYGIYGSGALIGETNLYELYAELGSAVVVYRYAEGRSDYHNFKKALGFRGIQERHIDRLFDFYEKHI